MSDSQMVADSGILKCQKEFSEADASSDEPFTNVFDKGFKNVVDASMEGQKCLAPSFSKGKTQQFTRVETLHTACVAVIRSGNERAVKRAKLSWMLKRGMVEQTYDVDMFCDLWLAWTFQVNFMYDNYL